MSRLGLLLTLTEPPPAMEEEFNAWYDGEHLAERLAIPGFRSATRWVADVPPGQGKYLATYELDSVKVLSSPAYLARFQNQTPWSRRCLGKALGVRAGRAGRGGAARRDAGVDAEPRDAERVAGAALRCGERRAHHAVRDARFQRPARHCRPPLPTLSAMPGCR